MLSVYFSEMIKPDNFYNDGFGWICCACEQELKALTLPETRSRLMHEGEAESKSVRLSNSALAKWTDPTRTALVCPRCGIEEKILTAGASSTHSD